MKLTYATFLARDVDRLASFYVDGLGLEEVESSRDERYREVKAGGAMIGFATAKARAALNVADVEPTGARSLLTYDVGELEAIVPAIERAVAHGARLVRDVADTFFGQRQAVLADPEENLFRLSARLA